MEDEDDPVVREIPVYLASGLNEALYIVQYPHFSTGRTNDANTPADPPIASRARLRPKFGKLELDVPMVGVEGVDDDHYDNQALDHQMISEHKMVSSMMPITTSMFIGAMRQGEFHLTPVNRILQLRASLEHLDKHDDLEQDRKQKAEEEYLLENGMEKEPVKVSKAQSVSKTGGYRKRESERALKTRLNSYQHLLKQELSEPFSELDVHNKWSDKAYEEFEHMFWTPPAVVNEEGEMDTESNGLKPAPPPWLTQITDQQRVLHMVQRSPLWEDKVASGADVLVDDDLTDTLMREHGVSDDAALAAIAWASRAPQEMLSPFSGAAKFNYINGPITNEENDDADEGDFSLDMLSTLPLEEKLLTVLKRSGVISYHLIRDLVVNTERSANGSKTEENLDGEGGGGSHDWSDDDIVAALDEVAVLVNGAMWVVRSYHVLEDKVLIDCRDLIISVLRSEGSIIRQALTAVVTSDALDLEEERAPEVEEILESLACIDRQTRSWKLRLPPGNFHESSGLVNATDKLPAAMVNMARHEALQWEVRNMELQPLLDIYYAELGAVTASRRKKTRPPRCLSRN